MMMAELAVAGALVGTLLVVCLQLLSAALAQRRAADQRQAALVELGNVMEQVAARPWADLTTAALSQEKLSPSSERVLPGAELKIEVSPSADGPDARRITVVLRWQDRGRSPVSMTLTTWRYRTMKQ